MKRILRLLWTLACLAVLIITVTKYDATGYSDIGVFLVWAMLSLCFPVSLLVAAAFAGLIVVQEKYGVPALEWIQSNYFAAIVWWLAFFGAGYWQWFHLVPTLWRKWCKERGA